MHRDGLPERFSDGDNRLLVGVPLTIRFAGSVGAVRDRTNIDTRDRGEGVWQHRYGARGAHPQHRGQADREENQASHQPILPVTAMRSNVNPHHAASTQCPPGLSYCCPHPAIPHIVAPDDGAVVSAASATTLTVDSEFCSDHNNVLARSKSGRSAMMARHDSIASG